MDISALASLVRWVEYGLIAYVGTINLLYLALVVLGFFVLRNSRGHLTASERAAMLKSPLTPGVSVVAPAFNESATIRQSVRAMLSLDHPNHEVIVVNDGSTDGTLEILIAEFRLYKSARVARAATPCQPIRAIYESRDPIPLVVVDKLNGGGKADATNAGLNVAQKELVAVVDSDSLLDPNALLYVVKPFMENPECVATGGIVRVINGCRVSGGRVERVDLPRSLLGRFQVVEYFRAFLGGRVAFGHFNSLLLISGAFGLFKREMVVKVGGFLSTSLGEDMEMVFRLHHTLRKEKRAYTLVFVPDPVCWTEVPEDFRSLGGQRNRWQRGTTETILAHREMLFNPRYGVIGLCGIPYFAMFEMIGPGIEFLGYILSVLGILMGFVSPQTALLFFLVSVVFGLFLSTGSILLQEFTLRRYPSVRHILNLFAAAVIENFGYRQLMTFWRAKGLLDGLRGKTGWGVMERRGFQQG